MWQRRERVRWPARGCDKDNTIQTWMPQRSLPRTAHKHNGQRPLPSQAAPPAKTNERQTYPLRMVEETLHRRSGYRCGNAAGGETNEDQIQNPRRRLRWHTATTSRQRTDTRTDSPTKHTPLGNAARFSAIIAGLRFVVSRVTFFRESRTYRPGLLPWRWHTRCASRRARERRRKRAKAAARPRPRCRVAGALVYYYPIFFIPLS